MTSYRCLNTSQTAAGLKGAESAEQHVTDNKQGQHIQPRNGCPGSVSDSAVYHQLAVLQLLRWL